MNKKGERRASSSGYHFLNLYQNCAWKFFLKYVARLIPVYKDSALIQGGAVHEGISTFFKTRSKVKSINKVVSEIADQATLIESTQEYERILHKAPILLDYWIALLGNRYLADYTLISSERELRLKIPNTPNFVYTVRPDAVISPKGHPSTVYILEFKTSSSSWRTTEMGVRFGDQSTGYMWAVSSSLKLKVSGVLPNILYWNKKSDSETNIEIIESDIVERTRKDIEEFKAGLAMLTSEVTQKVKSFQSGKFPAYMLFPRNTYYCNSYFRPCEYANICRLSLSMKGRAPQGFKRDTYSKAVTITSPTEL